MSELNIKFHSLEQKEYFYKLIQKIQDFYETNLMSLAIFGSMARKENRPNSDCDLLIILNNNYKKSNLEKIKEFVQLEFSLDTDEERCFKSGVRMEISSLILTQEQASHFNPLYLDMAEHVIIIMDQNNFLANHLLWVQSKMKQWGSKKVKRANGWYWDIKPNLQWGEIINYDE